MTTGHEKRELYKLILARSDITSALFACRFFIKNIKDVKNELWLPMQEAIIISYARPFTNNKPFGSLKKSWSEMPTIEMQNVHDQVINARNMQIAHSDLKQNKVFIFPKGLKLPPDNHPSSSIGVEIHNFKFPIPFFLNVEKLCLFLGRKIHSEIEKKLINIYGNVDFHEKIELTIE